MSETQSENIVADLYDSYNDSQKEILAIESRKTRNKIFTVGLIIFISDLLGLIRLDAVTGQTILYISIVPLIYVGLGFFALKEPLAAIIIAAVIIIGLWIYIIASTGAASVIQGWLIKAVVIYLLLAGLQNAKEAQRIKKELKN